MYSKHWNAPENKLLLNDKYRKDVDWAISAGTVPVKKFSDRSIDSMSSYVHLFSKIDRSDIIIA